MKSISIWVILLLSFICKIDAQQYNAFALKGSKWNTNSIEVTWENPTPDNQQEREWVKQAIFDSWQKVADINFTNWGKSKPNSKGIRILISDEGPHVKFLGNNLDGLQNGMVLNFTFNNWSPVMKNNRKNYIIAIAVHEFGHALGFAHEHNRTDCYFCDEEAQGTSGDYWITTCDLESVMNYCNPNYSNWGILSKNDIIGVTTLYGDRKKPSPIPTSNNNKSINLLHISRNLTAEELLDWPSQRKFIQIYVKGSDEALKNIEKVVYELHPTFQPNLFQVDDMESNFGLGIYVWGTFEAKAEVTFKDKTVKVLSRYLSFDDNNSSSSGIKLNYTITLNNTQNNRYQVNLYLDADDQFLNEVEYVQYTLHPTFNPNIYQIRNNSDKFSFQFNCWGEFMVYGKVVMKDGKTYNLSRYLDL